MHHPSWSLVTGILLVVLGAVVAVEFFVPFPSPLGRSLVALALLGIGSHVIASAWSALEHRRHHAV